jgi:DNA polymerase-1
MNEIPDYSLLLEKEINYCDTFEKTRAELWRMTGLGNRIGVDTETKTMDPHTGRLRLVQIADVTGRIAIFDTWKIGLKGCQFLADFIENPTVVKIFHHAKFDIKFLKKHLGIKEIYPVICTMIEASLLACGDTTVSKSLQSTLIQYLGITIEKELQVSDWTREYLSLSQLEYAAVDCKHLIQLHSVMYSAIKRNGMEHTFRHEMNCVPVTAEMELNGMPLNFEKWCVRADADEAESKEEAWKIYELCDEVSLQGGLFGEPNVFNINSPVQLKAKFRQLGIPIPIIEERDGRVRETTGKDQLKEIEHVHPVISHIINQRILHKAYTTYGRNWSQCINSLTGRVHANYNQNGSETGRFTTGEGVSDHMDPPMLGIPRAPKYRNCFEANAGRSLVWGDYSQIELRILADSANDKLLLQAFIDGRDPHLDAAVRLFGVDPDSVSSEMRHLAKDLNYAIPYGVAPPKFAVKAHITEEESKKLIEKYFEIYPGIKTWLNAAGWRAITHKSCRTASGRLLKFRYNEKIPREVSMARRNGKNAPIQGTCSDIIKVALFLVYKEIKKTNIIICHVFHDEIILECNNEDVILAEKILNKCMVDAGQEFLKRVPIKVDIKSGQCWGK